MRITLTKKLLFFLILTFFLMSICMSGSGVVAKENPEFVKVTSPPPKYETVSGMVKNGSVVSISVVLTNFSKEIEGNKSELFFHSDLENPVWGISIDGLPKECSSPFTIDHRKVTEARITLTGKAPEVNTRKENVTLLNITQKIKEEYSVIDIKRGVTSEIIEDAITAMDEAQKKLESANWTIANATKAGVDVSEADTNFETARLYLKDANDAYWGGRAEDSIEAARNASHYAVLAKEKAESTVGSMKYRNYGILAAVVIIAIVAFVFLIRHRGRKRGIY